MTGLSTIQRMFTPAKVIFCLTFLGLLQNCLFIEKNRAPKCPKKSSSPFGKNGKAKARSISPAFNFDSQQVTPASVVLSGGQYQMFYSGYDGTAWRIGRAVSTNGLEWSRAGLVLNYGQNIFSSDGVRDPAVTYDPQAKTWFMVYTGINGDNSTLISATSRSGTSWTTQGRSVIPGAPGSFDSFSVSQPSLVQSGATHILYYSAYDSNVYSIGRAYTLDQGENWIKEGQIVGPGDSGIDTFGVRTPFVYLDSAEELYLMWYQALKSENDTSIGFAVTTPNDDLQWFKKGKFIDTGADGETDDFLVERPAYINDGISHWMYYAGSDGTTSRIHAATCTANDTIDCRLKKNYAKRGSVLDIQPFPEFDARRVDQPSAVVLGNGTVRLYYAGFDGVEYSIGFAESANLEAWSRGGNIIPTGENAFEASGLNYPSVFKKDNIFHLYYLTQSTLGGPIRLLTANRMAGKTFTQDNSLPYPAKAQHTMPGSITTLQARVNPFNGNTQLVFQAQQSGQTIFLAASSPDGINFEEPVALIDDNLSEDVDFASQFDPASMEMPYLFTPSGEEPEELFFIARSAEGKRIFRLERLLPQDENEENNEDNEGAGGTNDDNTSGGETSEPVNPLTLPWVELVALPVFDLEFESQGVTSFTVFHDPVR